ncbi:MAG: PDZ domain-containing protein, partial [Paracoccaceae bacterium]|nr:PDZ domain-containing protein [Paracoccaceae bacterium]
DILVELATAPEDPPREIIEFDRRDFFPGLIISSINPAVQAELHLPWESKGFIVIDPGPLAVRVGLKAGDIIRKANGRQVQTGYDIDEFLRQNNRRGEILIQRGSRQIMLRFRL